MMMRKGKNYSLVLTIFLMFTSNLFSAQYWELKKNDVNHYFGYFLDQKDWNTISDASGTIVKWPINPNEVALNELFTNYLTHMGIQFEKKNSKEAPRLEKQFINLTHHVWYDIPESFPIPQTVKQMIIWENFYNQLNAPSERLAPIFSRINHYEIPLDTLDAFIADYADKDILRSMIGKNSNGKEVLKWIVNPEDSANFEVVEKFLRENDVIVSEAKKNNYYCLLTSSRSLMVVDPETFKAWSVKVSTNHTGGPWKGNSDDKKGVLSKLFSDPLATTKRLGKTQSKDSRASSDVMHLVSEHVNYRFMQPLYETISYSMPEYWQSLIIREYPREFLRGEKYLLPGFTVINEEVGKEIALKNGDHDPASFWRKNYNLPLAFANAEMAAYTGHSYNSAHGQQFLVELDLNFKPTGKIALRDFSDLKIYYYFFDKKFGDNAHYLSSWVPDYIEYNLFLRYGVFKTSKSPSWLFTADEIKDNRIPPTFVNGDQEEAWQATVKGRREKLKGLMQKKDRKWANEYYDAFRDFYHTLTSVDLNSMKPVEDGGSSTTYVTIIYPMDIEKKSVKESVKNYTDFTSCFEGQTTTKKGVDCAEKLQNIQRSVDSYFR